MNRRTIIGSCIAALFAVVLPWKKAEASVTPTIRPQKRESKGVEFGPHAGRQRVYIQDKDHYPGVWVCSGRGSSAQAYYDDGCRSPVVSVHDTDAHPKAASAAMSVHNGEGVIQLVCKDGEPVFLHASDVRKLLALLNR